MPVKLLEFLQQFAAATTTRISDVLAAMTAASKSTAGLFGYDATQQRFFGVRTNGGAASPIAHLSDIAAANTRTFAGTLPSTPANENIITHSLNTTKVNSVTLIGADNFPILPGWEVIDANSIRITTLADYADLAFSIVALP